MEEMVKYLRALVFLNLEARSGETVFAKPELLLSRAGFKVKEIAEIVGKKESAVAKAIERARKSKSTGDQDDGE